MGIERKTVDEMTKMDIVEPLKTGSRDSCNQRAFSSLERGRVEPKRATIKR